MFVKVKSTENKKGWWVFQTDSQVYYLYGEWESKKEYEANSNANYLIFKERDGAILPSDWDYSKKPFEFIKLVIILRNGEVRVILFNTVAYICNDAGKTIEVIRVD